LLGCEFYVSRVVQEGLQPAFFSFFGRIWQDLRSQQAKRWSTTGNSFLIMTQDGEHKNTLA
jgi:hypothetical protein